MQTRILIAAMILFLGWVKNVYADTPEQTDTQQQADTSEPTDSYTIQRLLISNEKQEILLVRHKNGWMTPALRHQSNMTIQSGLSELAADYGGQISAPELAGMFMFLPEYKKGASFRQYFRANWLGGELVTPEGLLETRWFSHEKAEHVMSLPAKIVGAEKEMTMWLIEHPQSVWGGSFVLMRKDGALSYELVEPFFVLGN